jgi:hypothetical protein
LGLIRRTYLCSLTLQAGLIGPFITQPVHSQFILLVAIGLLGMTEVEQ